jgi:mannose-6-phosphate isomerase-like protein (cupin superfamily)
MWLSQDHDLAEPPMWVQPGTSFVISAGAAFQLRNVGPDPIDFIGVTMPPWPGDQAARVVCGPFD